MRWRRAGGLLAVLALVATACGEGADGDARGGSDGKIAVVAGFYPLFEAAQRIGGDRARVTNVTPAGTEPHDLEVTSREVDAIAAAEVVLYLGQDFQPAIERLAERADGTAVDLLEGADVDGDPHIWLDPVRMTGIAERVRDTYIEVDSDNATLYRQNAAAYLDELRAVAGEFESGLARCQRRTIVTAHSAFGHLAKRYGLTQQSIAGLSPESEPNPRRVAELAETVRTHGITTIFYEALVSPEVAETLAREAGVKTALLDPLEGLPEEQAEAGADYASVMRQNLAALRDALGCT